ncbi:PilX N-terminal domain-containing pilus assembly protein [Azoarcus sp. TTM-91]|uniref:pilus assembly PilX family protein n=1 Tax=Azoarcus sp. TTM-91 TaxID=2691581 RepID=UPI001B7D1368
MKTRRPHITALSEQHGVALVVALILLLLVTMIGLAGMRGTTLQERMTSNLYDRELAFQAAESALRAAEAAIAADETAFQTDCSATACTTTPAITGITWISPSLSLGDVTAAPSYHIQYLGEGAEDSSDVDTCGGVAEYGSSGCTKTVARYYRITARSAGDEGRAAVWLQATMSLSSTE